jgi:putative transposase
LGRAARRRVERLSRKTQDKTTFRRCQIVLKTAQGESRMQIAAALNCDVSTVSRALAAFREHGESGLLRKVSPGRPRKLTDEQVKRLDETVEQEPREMGKNHSNWSSQTLTGYLDLPVHPVTVQRYLKRLGWRWRRPRHRIASPDPRYTPKRRYLRKLERRARRGEIWLYYADEVDIDLLPTLSGRWMRVGQQHSVDTPGKNHKTYGFGAVNVVTGWLAWLVWPHKNNVGFRHLLTQVLRLHPADAGKIVVVVDNYRIHKTQAVNQMLTKLKGHLRLYFLPTYSPTLNPIERLWRYFREQVTSNYFFKTMSRLLVAVEGFFAELVASPDVVLNLVSVA